LGYGSNPKTEGAHRPTDFGCFRPSSRRGKGRALATVEAIAELPGSVESFGLWQQPKNGRCPQANGIRVLSSLKSPWKGQSARHRRGHCRAPRKRRILWVVAATQKLKVPTGQRTSGAFVPHVAVGIGRVLATVEAIGELVGSLEPFGLWQKPKERKVLTGRRTSGAFVPHVAVEKAEPSPEAIAELPGSVESFGL